MPIHPIGSITILTNDNYIRSAFRIHGIDKVVSDKIRQYVELELNKRLPEYPVVVTKVETTSGCILTTVFLGIDLELLSIGLLAGYQFFVDYSSLRQGVKDVFSDLRLGCLYMLGVRRTEPNAELIANADAFVTTSIGIRGELSTLPLPAELKEKIQSATQGEFSYINETVIKEVMAVKREDLIENIEYTYVRTDKVTVIISTPDSGNLAGSL